MEMNRNEWEKSCKEYSVPIGQNG